MQWIVKSTMQIHSLPLFFFWSSSAIRTTVFDCKASLLDNFSKTVTEIDSGTKTETDLASNTSSICAVIIKNVVTQK